MSETAEIAAVAEATKINSTLDNPSPSTPETTGSKSLLERIADTSKKSGPEETLKDIAGVQESMVRTDEADSEVPTVIKTKDVRISENGKTCEFYDYELPTGEPVKVVFKNREEVIDPNVISERHTVIVGDEPQHLPQEKYSQWQGQLNGKDGATKLEHSLQGQRLAELSSDGGLTMVVNQDPESLTQAALILGAKDPQVRNFYHQARNYRYSDELLQTIDTAIAAHVFKTDGTKDMSHQSHDSEALTLAAFLGDENSTELRDKIYEAYLHDNQEESASRDQARADEIAASLGIRGEAEPLGLEDLAAVHITKFYPQYDEESGRWKIKTNFNSTRGKYPRTTLHFALNHAVTSHMGGNWGEKPITIIVPLKDLVNENGNPENLNTVDTFWNLNPGQDLTLPDSAVIIAPGKLPEGEKIGYGSSLDTLSHKGPEDAIKKLNYEVPSKSEILALRRQKTAAKTYEEQEEREVQIEQETAKIADHRDEVVEQQLKAMGFEIYRGTEHGWADMRMGRRVGVLADSMSINVSKHTNTVTGILEKIMSRRDLDLEEGKIDRPDHERMEDAREINRLWPDITPQQRRLMWTLGFI